MTERQPPPLAGVTVVELAQMVAGPAAGLLLADYGADVIKVEPPQGDGGRQLRSGVATHLPDAPLFLAYNRNKRTIRLDLRDPEDRGRVEALIAHADVVLESSRPGAMDRLGLGAETVLARHPGLVYASVSGFGWTGPGAVKGGVDMIVQAESGVMSTTGPAGGEPTKVGFTIIDAATGHAVTHGILAALLRRRETGRGEIVRVSLYDVALQLATGPLAEYLMTGRQTPRSGNSAPLTAPADLFHCGEGSIVISAYLEPHWQRLVAEIEAPELAADPRFASSADRVEHRDALKAAIEERLQARSAAAWRERLEAAGLLVGEVRDLAGVVASPLTAACGVLGEADGVPAVRTPVTLLHTEPVALRALRSVTAAELAGPAPAPAPTGPPAAVADGADALGDPQAVLPIGERFALRAHAPVSAAAIRAWCGAIGERNPVHLDEAAARAAGHDGIVAPPSMLQSWVAPGLLPEPDDPPTVHRLVRDALRALGFTAVVATDYQQEYDRLVGVGERLAQTSWIEAVSERKARRSGSGTS